MKSSEAQRRQAHPNQMPRACWDEEAAHALLETLRWGDAPTCPWCGDDDVYAVKSRSGGRCRHHRWCCRACRRQYTVRKGTVMEETRLPLRHWCYACWAICNSTKGVSPLQISRHTGMTPRSARYLLSRITYALTGGAPI